MQSSGSSGQARRAVLLLALAVSACASAGPRTFRFGSNLAPGPGRACALAILRRHGFEFAPPTPRDSTVVALRAPHRTAQGAGEWWRAEVSAGTDADGRTVVTSVVGASPREAGPFSAPPAALDELASEVTARCMWAGS